MQAENNCLKKKMILEKTACEGSKKCLFCGFLSLKTEGFEILEKGGHEMKGIREKIGLLEVDRV